MCNKCQDTGVIYNEGNYGWDYGGYYFCDCVIGMHEEETFRLSYENENPPPADFGRVKQ